MQVLYFQVVVFAIGSDGIVFSIPGQKSGSRELETAFEVCRLRADHGVLGSDPPTHIRTECGLKSGLIEMSLATEVFASMTDRKTIAQGFGGSS